MTEGSGWLSAGGSLVLLMSPRTLARENILIRGRIFVQIYQLELMFKYEKFPHANGTYSTSWAQNWKNKPANKARLIQPSNKKDELGPAQKATEASLLAYLSTVYNWRLHYANAHGLHISMEEVLTANRVLRCGRVCSSVGETVFS